MKRIFLVCCIFTGIAMAQNAPNCNQQNNIILTTATAGASFNATSVKCVAWTFSYFSEGFSALTVQVEYAPDSGGTPGTWTVIPVANLVSGTLPLTNIVSSNITINGYFPWMRVNLTSATGTGFINYTLVGNSYVGASSQVSSSSSSGTSNVNVTQFGSNNVQTGLRNSGVGIPDVTVTSDSIVNTGIFRGISGGDDGRNSEIYILGQGTNESSVMMNQNIYSASGNTWNRTRDAGVIGITAVGGAGASGSALSANPVRIAGSDGTNTQNLKVASTTNLPTSALSSGALLQEKGARWSVVSTPAAGTQASASKAAGAAGVSHVVDCIGFSASDVVVPVLTALTVDLRDGASGAGTIIWQYSFAATAVLGEILPPHSICGLNIKGTAATAMTIEFSAALANLSENVNLTGYDVN